MPCPPILDYSSRCSYALFQAEKGEAIIKRGGAGEDAVVEITEDEMAGWSRRKKAEASTDDASGAPAAPR
jgi:hypothetical protein